MKLSEVTFRDPVPKPDDGAARGEMRLIAERDKVSITAEAGWLVIVSAATEEDRVVPLSNVVHAKRLKTAKGAK